MGWRIYILMGMAVMGCSFRHDKVDERLHGLRPEPTFAWIQAGVLEPRCVSCHNGSTPDQPIDLSSYAKLMASKVVQPGAPEMSAFYLSVFDGSMPMNGDPLPAEHIAMIKEWIEKGATEVQSGPEPDEPPPTPSVKGYSYIYNNVLSVSCVRCHQPPTPKGKVDLSTYQAMMDSTGKKLKPVMAGSPEQSGIFMEVQSQKMPPGPNKISADNIQIIREWIERGAKENE